MYHFHTSPYLNDLFISKPYQGVAPDQSQFLFVGLDANYSANIESEPIFPKILEYHEDGAAFWRKYGVHHPFLLPGYSGDGKRFHQRFAKIGFSKQHADLVSFAELIETPTTGRSSLEVSDLSENHIERLHQWIFNGGSQYIFFSAGVTRILRQTRDFACIPAKPIGHQGQLQVLLDEPNKRIFQHLHFSNYGVFEKRLQQQSAEIRRLIPSNILR